MKYLVEYYFVENGDYSIDYYADFTTLDAALNYVRDLLTKSNAQKYFIIEEISIVNDNLTDYFSNDVD